MTDFEQKQVEDARRVKRELGSPSLKERVKRFVRGDYNYSRQEKRGAEYREDVKLAKLLEERRQNGERARTKKKRGKKKKKKVVDQTR